MTVTEERASGEVGLTRCWPAAQAVVVSFTRKMSENFYALERISPSMLFYRQWQIDKNLYGNAKDLE